MSPTDSHQTSSSSRPAIGRARLQFTLRQALLAVGVISGLCALARMVGPGPPLLVVLAISIALVTISVRRRNAMMATIGFLMGAVSIGILIVGSTEMRASGKPIKPLTVVVWDAKTQTPVAGAIVRIREISDVTLFQNGAPVTTIPPQEKVAHGLADSQGSVTLRWNFRYSSYDSLWRHERILYLERVHSTSSALYAAWLN